MLNVRNDVGFARFNAGLVEVDEQQADILDLGKNERAALLNEKMAHL